MQTHDQYSSRQISCIKYGCRIKEHQYQFGKSQKCFTKLLTFMGSLSVVTHASFHVSMLRSALQAAPMARTSYWLSCWQKKTKFKFKIAVQSNLTSFPFSALSLLAGWQEWYPASKNLVPAICRMFFFRRAWEIRPILKWSHWKKDQLNNNQN